MNVEDKLDLIRSQNAALEFVLISLQVFILGLILVLGLKKDKKIKRS